MEPADSVFTGQESKVSVSKPPHLTTSNFHPRALGRSLNIRITKTYNPEGVIDALNDRLKHMQNLPDLATEGNWSVAELARFCNVGVRTLETYFVKAMGKTPKAWLQERRQKKAAGLLQDGWLVKEVAIQLGYKHSTHFSREFKKYWGYSPTQVCSQAPSRYKLRILV